MWILSPGDLFAERYRVLHELGSGGMSYVFAAEDVELNEKVALKVIRPDFVDEADFVERFKREVRIARQIQHPNIVRVLEFGGAVVRDKRLYFLTMELLEGGDLATLMREKKELALADVLRIGLQTCDALAEAHRIGVVHRDIKPQNIFIERDGRVKLMDFGISRLPSLPSVTTGGQLVGTPKYMSPEQVHRKTEPDHRSDIYSLGVVLYELVAQRAPFEGSTVEVALLHIQKEPPPPSEINPLTPPALEDVILKCLRKEPRDRFQSIDELRAELQSIPSVYQELTVAERATEILGMLPTERTPGVPRTAVAEPASGRATLAMETVRRRPRALTRIAIGLALAAAVALTLFVLTRSRPLETPPPAVESARAEPESPPPALVESAEPAPPRAEPAEESPPPPPPKAEVREGELVIDSHPSGAKVTVDGRGVGATPWRGRLPAGRKQVTVASAGYVTAAERIDLPAGETVARRFDLRSEEVVVSVRFSANPGTEIYLDGALLGAIPPVIEKEVRVGAHSLRYVMPDYAEHEETIRVQDQPRQEFTHRFPVPGSLRVSAQPYAQVFLDGNDLGFTPVRVEKVSEGEHLLVLEREGFERIERRISVKPFEVNRFQFELVRKN